MGNCWNGVGLDGRRLRVAAQVDQLLHSGMEPDALEGEDRLCLDGSLLGDIVHHQGLELVADRNAMLGVIKLLFKLGYL